MHRTATHCKIAATHTETVLKSVADIDGRESEMHRTAQRGLTMYENLLRGIPLQAQILKRQLFSHL